MRGNLDLNSLLEGIHTGPETRAGLWAGLTANSYSYFDGTNYWALMNPAQDSGTFGIIAKSFVVPPGTTQIRVSCVIQQSPTNLGVAASAMDWGILTTGGSYVAGCEDIFTPSGTPTTRTITTSSLTPGTTYQIIFRCNVQSTNAAFMVRNLQLTPTAGATGLFAQPFNRLRVDHTLMLESAEPDRWDANGYCIFPTPMSRCSITTDATTLVLQVYSDFNYQPGACIHIRVNGKRWGKAVVTANAGEQLVTVSGLPIGYKTIDLLNGSQGINGSNVASAAILKAIYAPAIAVLAPASRPTTHSRKFMVYGDSISIASPGGLDDVGDASGSVWQAIAADGQLSIYQKGHGSRALYFDAGASIPELNAFVAGIVELRPDDFYCAIGTNDYGFGTFSNTTGFTTILGGVLSGIHAGLPNTRIWVQTPLSRASETVNNPDGWNLPNLRTAIASYCASVNFLASGTTPFDGSFFNSANTDDGLHPNALGTAQYLAKVRGWLGLQ